MRIFSLCWLLMVANLGVAADDKAAAQLRQYLDSMNSLQGQFVQTISDAEGELQEESRGDFMLQRPGKFYWNTTEPMAQLLVSDGKTIWLYDPDLETLNQRAVSEDMRETPALLLSEGVDKLRQTFTISYKVQGKAEQFTLTPKVTEGLFQRLVLVFEKGVISEFLIEDTLGQVTRSQLGQVKHNQPLAEEKFHFIAPPGTEIIKN